MEQSEYDRVYKLLLETDPMTKEHDMLLEKLKKINDVAIGEQQAFPPDPPTGIRGLLANKPVIELVRDGVVTGAVLYHERTGVITSRLFAFIKPIKSLKS